MIKEKKLPTKIPVFPLSNFIIFPDSTVPLNIFEPRYIKMIDDSMRGSRIIGMIQPKNNSDNTTNQLYKIGCAGKITSFNESEDGRYLVILSGISRFQIMEEVKNEKTYRECIVNFTEFKDDLKNLENLNNTSDLKKIFKELKLLFEKRGYIINWNDLEKQNPTQIINTLSMASPFTLEEKQMLLETKSLNLRRIKLEEILKTYTLDNFSNTTIQ